MHQLDFTAVYNCIEGSDPFSIQVREAFEVLSTALDKYGEEHVAISFNGGKDCTVLLHLLAAVRSRRRRNDTPSESQPPSPPVVTPIKSIYITCSAPFPAVENFVTSTTLTYDMSLYRTSPGGLAMKEALVMYRDAHSDIAAIIVGTRRDDPHGAQLDFESATDPGWPSFMRIHPIINWSYHDVWVYLRRFQVPYCDLYDKGYTSLGSVHNTFPNPALRISDTAVNGNQPAWNPAYELQDGKLERAGRVSAAVALRNDNER